MNAVTIPRSLDALRRRRPCRAPLARPLFSMPLPQSQLFAFSERIIWHLAGQFPRQ